eukprot:TRINITY_DN31369_c0_g1_i1.p1 TRINITY_DN31369_c0_g1~~TRINITY_DN31369_c0_g1_i1.p1  ORF type:complete len:532 (-),score=35.81 TRINITY_DN31369_c0_g1_i1:195-1790(-)
MLAFWICLGIFTTCIRARIRWGTATAAYQVEGFRNADGRQASIWDAFDTPNLSRVIHSTKPNGHANIYHNESGQTADAEYSLYSSDVALTKEYGFQAVRMSISWPRIMAYRVIGNGTKLTWSVNKAGVQHYKDVLNTHKQIGLSTALTMFHWDLPLVVEEFAAGQACSSAWLCHDWIGDVFGAYADVLLSEFRDLVTWWITINEPVTVVSSGYADGSSAPGRCSDRRTCWAGNSRTEPYQAGKGLLLAHAKAFRAWEKHGRPGISCGLLMSADWRVPFTASEADRSATQRDLEWHAAFFMDPVYFGEWPTSMRTKLGIRLPALSETESQLINGTHDGRFYLNGYSANFVRSVTDRACGWACDTDAETSGYNFTSNVPIGTPSSNGWLFNYGPSLGSLVSWYDQRYHVDSFVIAENGWGNASASVEEELLDFERCNYYRDAIGNLSAIVSRDNLSVEAYFAWSLLDNFEWADGYSVRFGLTYVDYATQIRRPKLSAHWFKKHITPSSTLPHAGEPLPACDASLLDRSSNVVV